MPKSVEAQLAEIRSRSLLRRLHEVASPQGTLIEIGGKTFVNFSSNDYLGLANKSFLCEAAKRAIDTWGVGAGASRLICGTLSPHVELERRLVKFKRAEAALTFSSGY